jgi:hypothetical protein
LSDEKKLSMAALEFHPGVYGTPPPDVTGRAVILVDFSYKRPVMEDLCRTAAAELDGLDEWAAVQGFTPTTHIDMGRSGAVLAWEYFHPGQPIPRLLQHVQDRDLWRFALTGTREILACVFSHPFVFGLWDTLVAEIDLDPAAILAEGRAIERKHHRDIAELLATTMHHRPFG